MSKRTLIGVAVAGALALTTADALGGRITLYERPGFQGDRVATIGAMPNVQRSNLDDAAASVIIDNGTWEACTQANFRGTCAELEPGQYGNLDAQLNGAVRSVREIADSRGVTHVVVSPDVAVAAVEPARRMIVVPPGRAVLYQNPNFSALSRSSNAAMHPTSTGRDSRIQRRRFASSRGTGWCARIWDTRATAAFSSQATIRTYPG